MGLCAAAEDVSVGYIAVVEWSPVVVDGSVAGSHVHRWSTPRCSRLFSLWRRGAGSRVVVHMFFLCRGMILDTRFWSMFV